MAHAVFTRRFCAAHRVAQDPGVCQRIHGHNYVAEITVDAEFVDASGFVIPADLVKQLVDRQYDHKLILAEDDQLSISMPVPDGVVSIIDGNHPGDWDDSNWVVRVPGAPSTENLAQLIADDVAAAYMTYHGEPGPVRVTVMLRETDTIMAGAQASLAPKPQPKFLGSEHA